VAQTRGGPGGPPFRDTASDAALCSNADDRAVCARPGPAPTSVTAHHADGSTLRVDFGALGRVSNMSGTVRS